MTDSFRKTTLEWVNEVRKERGLEPISELPRGKVGNKSTKCPIALATGMMIGVTKAFPPLFSTSTKPVALPWEVALFIREYDHGEYPDLLPPDPTIGGTDYE